MTGEAASADCDGCDYRFEMSPSTGTSTGDYCDEWYGGEYAENWENGNIIDGLGMGFNVGESAILTWYDGSGGEEDAQWYPAAYGSASLSGDTLEWDLQLASYYY